MPVLIGDGHTMCRGVHPPIDTRSSPPTLAGLAKYEHAPINEHEKMLTCLIKLSYLCLPRLVFIDLSRCWPLCPSWNMPERASREIDAG